MTYYTRIMVYLPLRYLVWVEKCSVPEDNQMSAKTYVEFSTNPPSGNPLKLPGKVSIVVNLSR